MGRIEMAAQALGDGARSLGVPFISGNVSMYNESAQAAIPPTPSLLGIGLVEDIRKCVTTDIKRENATLYHIGVVADEMGGSHWYEIAGGQSMHVPRVNLENTKAYSDALVTAIEHELVAAAHDVGIGGIAVALAEMCMGGDMGARVDLAALTAGGGTPGAAASGGIAPLGDLATDVKLFSESNTRWIVEARDPARLEAHLAQRGVPFQKLGVTGGSWIELNDGSKRVVATSVSDARREWSEGLHRRVG